MFVSISNLGKGFLATFVIAFILFFLSMGPQVIIELTKAAQYEMAVIILTFEESVVSYSFSLYIKFINLEFKTTWDRSTEFTFMWVEFSTRNNFNLVPRLDIIFILYIIQACIILNISDTGVFAFKLFAAKLALNQLSQQRLLILFNQFESK